MTLKHFVTTLSHSASHSCRGRDMLRDILQHMVDLRGMLPTDWPQSAVPATCSPGRRNDLQIVYSFVRSWRHPSWAPCLHLRPLGTDIFHTAIFTRVNQYLRRVHWSRARQDSRHADDSRYCRITGCRGCMVRHASPRAACIHSLCITHCRTLKQASNAVSVIRDTDNFTISSPFPLR